jgi:integrase
MPKERGNGEGSLVQLKSKKWHWQIMVGRKEDGTRNVKSGTSKATGREGKEEAQAAMLAAKSLPIEYNPRTLMSEWADKWYADLKSRVEEHKLEESTYVGYNYTLALIKKQWGDKAIGELSTTDIEKGLDKILKPVPKLDKEGKPMVNIVDGKEKPEHDYVRYDFGIYKKIKTMLRQIYNRAEAAKVIQKNDNPMYLVLDLVNPEKKKKTKDSWTLDEAQTVLAAAPQFVGTSDYRYYCALIVAMAVPCRSQDVIPLMATDIEPDGSVIDINKAVKVGAKAKTYIGSTKAEASDRLAYLPEYAWRYAKWLRDNAKDGFILHGKLPKSHVHPTSYRDGVNRVIASIEGVRNLHPHEAQRHTGASISIFEADLQEQLAMKRTGHADPKTFRGYTHAHEKELKGAAAKVHNVMQKPQAEPVSDYSI